MPSEAVKVMVRVRPLSTKELAMSCKPCVTVDSDQQVTLTKPNDVEIQKMFTYDFVFGPDCPQAKIYEESSFALVENVVEGYNGTIFAYGQTGCGKTFTMMGDPNDDQMKGIIPRTFSHILKIIDNTMNKNFLVRCSFIEIYNEEIRDLLSGTTKTKCDLKESPDKGVFIKDCSMIIVKSYQEMDKYMTIGNKNRSTGETLMNKDSSRSHSIFSLYIEAAQKDEKGNDKYTGGKLNLVDLAGSERQSKTQATGDRLKEANKINLSLSALGNVISALVDGKSTHIPYRDSKLTRLLQDSLGGNTKTVMIAAASPADFNYDETLGTLRYASRAQNIQNKPKINEDPKDALLKEYASEIKRLKNILAQHNIEGFQFDSNIEMNIGAGVMGRGNNMRAQELTIIQPRKDPGIIEKSPIPNKSKVEKEKNEATPVISKKKVKKTVHLPDGKVQDIEMSFDFSKRKVRKSRKLPNGQIEEYESEVEEEVDPTPPVIKKIKKQRKLSNGTVETYETEVLVVKKKLKHKKVLANGEIEEKEIEVEVEVEQKPSPSKLVQPKAKSEKKTKRNQENNNIENENDDEYPEHSPDPKPNRKIKKVTKNKVLPNGTVENYEELVEVEIVKKEKIMPNGKKQVVFEEVEVEMVSEPPKKRVKKKRVNNEGKVEEYEAEVQIKTKIVEKTRTLPNGKLEVYEEEQTYEEEVDRNPKVYKKVKKVREINGKKEEYEAVVEVTKQKVARKVNKNGKMEEVIEEQEVEKEIKVLPSENPTKIKRKKVKKQRKLPNGQTEEYEALVEVHKREVPKKIILESGEVKEIIETQEFEVEIPPDSSSLPVTLKKVKKKRLQPDGTMQEVEVEVEVSKRKVKRQKLLANGKVQEVEEEVTFETELPEQERKTKKKVKKKRKLDNGKVEEYEAEVEVSRRRIPKKRVLSDGRVEEYVEEVEVEEEVSNNGNAKKTRTIKRRSKLPDGTIEEVEEEEYEEQDGKKPNKPKKVRTKRIAPNGKTEVFDVEIKNEEVFEMPNGNGMREKNRKKENRKKNGGPSFLQKSFNEDEKDEDDHEVLLIEQIISHKDDRSNSVNRKEINNLQNELKKKEEEIQREKNERELLEKLVKELDQNRMVGGGGKRKSDTEYLTMKSNIQKKSLQMENEKSKPKQEDYLLQDFKFTGNSGEIEQLQNFNRQLRKNYKNVLSELKDLQKDHELEREELLDTIREQDREMKLLLGMLKYMVRPEEITKVKLNSKWDDDNNDYVIPPFVFQEGNVKFPKLAQNQILDMIENEKSNRDLVFANDPFSNIKGYRKPYDSDKGSSLSALSDQYNDNPEVSTMPFLKNLGRLERENSIEKLAAKYMSQPQSSEVMQSYVNRMLIDSSMNPNNIETKYEKEASKSAFKKNISKVQLDPLIKQVDMSAFENKKNKKVYKGKTYLDPLRSPNQIGYDCYEYNSEH